jgi:hypothetical protein
MFGAQGMLPGMMQNGGISIEEFLKNPDLTNPMGEMIATQLSQ